MKKQTKQEVKTILVTGCAGFIGSNFVKKFKDKYPKATVIGIDNLSTGRKEVIDKGIVFYKISILDTKPLREVFKKHRPEYVFHFAALPQVAYSVDHPKETTEVNLIGVINLLEVSKEFKVKRFIFSSTAAVYGKASKLPINETTTFPNPISPYAIQKNSSEMFCRMYSELFGLDTVCLRYFNVFGPGQYGGSAYATVISAWLESSFFPNSKKAYIEGDGSQTRDFCYVDNITNGNILAMECSNNLKGEVINLASGKKIAVKEAKKLIEKYSNKKLDLEKKPARLGDIKHSHADISKAKKLIGYKPTTGFSEGLEKTIAWYKERKY